MGCRHYVPLRRRHDMPIRSREDIPLRRLGNIPLRRCWVFHLRRTCDVAGTFSETSLQRCHDVLLPGGLFLYYTHHNMNFHSCEKQIFKSLGCTKIREDSKWTKIRQKEVMQPTTSNNDLRPVFPYHIHNQADIEKPFISSTWSTCVLSIYSSSS